MKHLRHLILPYPRFCLLFYPRYHCNKSTWYLKNINSELWDIENIKREMEASKDFGENFIKISRDVHFKNDIRAKIKKDINNLTNSNVSEEKEYSKY